MASILIVAGPNQGDYYPLGHRTITIGRDEACIIQVVDELTSRSHVQIRFEQESGTYHATDLESVNGTFVNDRRLSQEVPLADGDVLGLGNSELMFSAMDFTDRETAFEHYRQMGERDRSTVLRDPE